MLLLTWKLHPFWIATKELEVALNSIVGEKESSVLPICKPASYNNTGLTGHVQWGKSDTNNM